MTLSPKQGARNLASLAGSFKFLAKFLPYKEGGFADGISEAPLLLFVSPFSR